MMRLGLIYSFIVIILLIGCASREQVPSAYVRPVATVPTTTTTYFEEVGPITAIPVTYTAYPIDGGYISPSN
jgi:hypothetical protein